MKTFVRSFSGFLLAAVMLLFCVWRYGLAPDLSGVSNTLQGALGQLNELTGLVEGQIPTPPAEGDETAPSVPFDDIDPITGLDKAFEEAMYQAVTSYQKVVNVGDFRMSKEDFQRSMSLFFFNNPELFYVSTAYYVNQPSGSPYVAQVQLLYLYEQSEIAPMITTYEAELAQIVAGVPTDGTDFDKILYLHDYFVQNFAYDYEGLATEKATGESVAIRDAYQFFTTKTGVCQAYMLGLIAAANEVGLECLPVTSEGMGHAWNLVKVDGEWYHIDVTWDDAGGESAPVYPTYVSYKHFLLSDEAMYYSDEDRQKGWEATQLAQSKLYDEAMWHVAYTPMLRSGDDYYCTVFYRTNQAQSGFFAIMCGNGVEMTVLRELPSVRWCPPNGDGNTYYPYVWSTLVEYEGVLVFNTASGIYFYGERGGVDSVWPITDLSASLAGRQIFGILDVAADGTLRYVAAMDHSGEYSIETVQIAIN